VAELQEELADWVKEYNALSSLHFACTAELNETKQILVSGQGGGSGAVEELLRL
jgi:hypothetical protein